MGIDLDKILPLTVSGLRSGEETAILELIAGCGLAVDDLSPTKLRHFLVARKGGQPVGVVGLEITGTRSVLRSLAVSEAYRDQGIACALISAVERYALSHGIEALYLRTTTAAEFFSRRGFVGVDLHATPVEIRNTRQFKELCPDGALCLTKTLAK